MSPLLLLILLPLIASLLIMVGANPRRTALGAAILNLILSVVLFARYDSMRVDGSLSRTLRSFRNSAST